jgi:asparagine synthase (glutamine-hydrolysing)
MCGIVGFAGSGTEAELRAMLASVKHRGPDDEGFLLRGEAGLAHARLSIIDTSRGARQPMELADKSVAVIFNGEIYNFKELRAELASSFDFKTGSDTEVILALYQKHGEGAFARMEGMFAIALYDFTKKKLILARDRMGEKPLYWSIQKDTLLFGSELKALLASNRVDKKINLEAVNQYLLYDYIPTPFSIISGVYKLEPATLLIYERGEVKKKKYWTPPAHVKKISKADAMQELNERLAKTVADELVADVPLGVFLSGGIDSSTVAYYAQKHARENGLRSIDTFSIGFTESSFDESRYAREVATQLGTTHHERIVSADDALVLIPKLADTLCEPVADASIIPTMLLSKFAREQVTVALGGDGGDELFAGYPTFQAEQVYAPYRRLPQALQTLSKKLIALLPASQKNFSLSYNLKKLVSSDNPTQLYRHMEWLGSFSKHARSKLAGPALTDITKSHDEFAHLAPYKKEMPEQENGNQLLWGYARSYLMDEVLVKVDRASMRYALETRAPFLNHPVVDFVFSLPYSLKYHRGTTKYILKELMKDKLPYNAVFRKKKGFGIPLAEWLRGPLRPLCEELLSPTALSEHNLFNEAEVKRLMQEHVAGKKDNRKELWNLVVFQLWYQRWMK